MTSRDSVLLNSFDPKPPSMWIIRNVFCMHDCLCLLDKYTCFMSCKSIWLWGEKKEEQFNHKPLGGKLPVVQLTVRWLRERGKNNKGEMSYEEEQETRGVEELSVGTLGSWGLIYFPHAHLNLLLIGCHWLPARCHFNCEFPAHDRGAEGQITNSELTLMGRHINRSQS